MEPEAVVGQDVNACVTTINAKGNLDSYNATCEVQAVEGTSEETCPTKPNPDMAPTTVPEITVVVCEPSSVDVINLNDSLHSITDVCQDLESNIISGHASQFGDGNLAQEHMPTMSSTVACDENIKKTEAEASSVITDPANHFKNCDTLLETNGRAKLENVEIEFSSSISATHLTNLINQEKKESNQSPTTSTSVSTSSSTSPQSCGGKKAADDAVLLELEQVLSDTDAGVSGLPSPWRHQVPHINCLSDPIIDEISLEVNNSSTSPENETSYIQQLENLQQQLLKLKSDGEKARDEHYVEVQALERTLAQERSRHQQQEDSSTRTIMQLKQDLEKRQKLLDSSNKDRESMVVKYAMSEKSVITVRRDLELSEKRLKDANRARDLLAERLKTVQADKEKANNLLETKGQELSTLNRENARLKEDLRWTQNKLKTENEGRKEIEHRVTDLIRRLEEARQEAEQAKKDAQVAIKSFQESQENKAVTLDQQLKEEQARLILERHERADSEGTLKQLQAEVDALKKKQVSLITENNQLSVKVQTLEKERLDGDQRISRLKQENDSHHQEVAELKASLAGIESLRAQIQHCEDQIAASRVEMDRLRVTNGELQQDAAACRQREAELLEFTQKLTEKNVRLQSEFSATEAKARTLENEQTPLLRRLTEAESKVATLSQQLEEEKRLRQEENSLLARHLAEKTHRAQQLHQQLEDSQGEIEVVKRKHATSLRELTRELQQVRKRQEAAESNGGGSSSSGTSLGQGSRASSTSSLNTVCEIPQTPTMAPVIFPNGQEPDKQVLIERLVKLQRENARKAEKLDFLEEHNQTLVTELQKKSRIIQNYVTHAPSGALSSASMDVNKHAITGFARKKQVELAKRSGIMASMYGTKTDDNMTLELSMEINRKLQAVLEDTLLKNITLKENIDTLGGEIERLLAKPTKSNCT